MKGSLECPPNVIEPTLRALCNSLLPGLGQLQHAWGHEVCNVAM